MAEDPPDVELDGDTRLFAGVLINHFETCFEHCRFGTIPDEFKEPILKDIVLSFESVSALRRRWTEVRAHLEPEFAEFIDGKLKEGKK